MPAVRDTESLRGFQDGAVLGSSDATVVVLPADWRCHSPYSSISVRRHRAAPHHQRMQVPVVWRLSACGMVGTAAGSQHLPIWARAGHKY
eukprot:SAG31_NODE_1274_length_9050_cov_10.910178_9_plen_90_part_00